MPCLIEFEILLSSVSDPDPGSVIFSRIRVCLKNNGSVIYEIVDPGKSTSVEAIFD